MSMSSMAAAAVPAPSKHSMSARWRHFRLQSGRWVAFARTLGLRQGMRAARIRTYTLGPELVQLYNLAQSCPPGGSVLEIGSYLGASTCFLAAAVRPTGGSVHCVDTWNNETMPGGCRDTFAEFRQNTRDYADVIRTVRKRSTELSAADVGSPVALAFLDGDHSYETTKSDFDIVSQMMGPAGTIAFHDCASLFPGVIRVVGEALSSGDWQLGGLCHSLCWIQKR